MKSPADLDSADYAIASICHDAHCAYQTVLQDPSPEEPWVTLPPWKQQSVAEGVALIRLLLQQGARPLEAARIVHGAWVDRYIGLGWRYGKTKEPDAVPPTHPRLVDWSQLAEQDKRKDLQMVLIVQAHIMQLS